MLFQLKQRFVHTAAFIGIMFSVQSLADDTPVGPMNRQLLEYITEGLLKSLTIRQEHADLLIVEASVKEARAKFFPTLSLTSRYTKANGGRSITLPVGDLMALMLQEPMGQDKINSLNATTISVVPERDQETRLQFTQPLFAPEIVENYRMNTLLLKARTAEVENVKLTLIRDIRNSYYACLQAKEAILVQSASCKRTMQQLHTAQKLFHAGMLTRTAVLVADAAHAKNVTDSTKSYIDFENACRAFNTLINHPIDEPVTLITPDSSEFAVVKPTDDPDTIDYSRAVSARREMMQMYYAAEALKSYERIEKSAFSPKIAAVLEGGIVGEHYQVTDNNRFYTASLLLQWELFDGFGQKYKRSKATLARKSLDAKMEATRAMMLLQIKKSASEQKIALRRCNDSEMQLLAAEKNYNEVLKQFEQGRTSTQELINAQSFLTSSDAGVLVSRYELFRTWAMLRAAIVADTGYIAHTSAKGF